MIIWAFLFILILFFLFFHVLMHFFFFFQLLNFQELVHSAKREYGFYWRVLFFTGYEPNAYDFNETSVEPYMQLLDSPPLFSDKVSFADTDYDDAAREDMFHQPHRAQAYHSLREDLSVSLSSSSMSDRNGRPVGEKLGRSGEHRSSEAQIRNLLDNQKKTKFIQRVKQEIVNTNFKQLKLKKFNNEMKWKS